jgi:hypothetical protein
LSAILIWASILAVVLLLSLLAFAYEISRPLAWIYNRAASPLLQLPVCLRPRTVWLRLFLHLLLIPTLAALLFWMASRGITGNVWFWLQRAFAIQCQYLLIGWVLFRLLFNRKQQTANPGFAINLLFLLLLLWLARGSNYQMGLVVAQFIEESCRLHFFWLLPGVFIGLVCASWRKREKREIISYGFLGAGIALLLIMMLDGRILFMRSTMYTPFSKGKEIAWLDTLRPWRDQVRLDPVKALNEVHQHPFHLKNNKKRKEQSQAINEALAWCESKRATNQLTWEQAKLETDLRMQLGRKLGEEGKYPLAIKELEKVVKQDSGIRMDVWGSMALCAALDDNDAIYEKAFERWQQFKHYYYEGEAALYDAAPLVRAATAGKVQRLAAEWDTFLDTYGAWHAKRTIRFLANKKIINDDVIINMYAQALAKTLQPGVEENFDRLVDLWKDFRNYSRSKNQTDAFYTATRNILQRAAPVTNTVMLRGAFIIAMGDANLPGEVEALRKPAPGWAGNWLQCETARNATGEKAWQPTTPFLPPPVITPEGMLHLDLLDGNVRRQRQHVLLAASVYPAAADTTLIIWHNNSLEIMLDGKVVLERRNYEGLSQHPAQVKLNLSKGKHTVTLRTDSDRLLVYSNPPARWEAGQ